MYGKIFKNAKTPTQSGSKDFCWSLELEPKGSRYIEEMARWTATNDTSSQLKLTFSSKEEAISYAKKHNIEFSLAKEQHKIFRPKSYAENFI